MENKAMLNTLINGYNAKSFTHHYIFGFIDRHMVYMVKTTAEVLPYVTCLDRQASDRGGAYSLRFKPTKSQKELLKTFETTILCSEDYMESIYNESKYNRGEVFEKLVTEHFGQEWAKDNVPFTEAGDIEVDGVAYQIKFNKATFCSEKQVL